MWYIYCDKPSVSIIHEVNPIFEDVGLLEYDAVWIVIYLPTFWRLLPLSLRSNKSKQLFRIASALKIDVAVYWWSLRVFSLLFYSLYWLDVVCETVYQCTYVRPSVHVFMYLWDNNRHARSYVMPLCMLFMYVIASKYSRNQFISEKYNTVQTFKLLFLQNSHLVQLYTSASDCKFVGNIPGSHFVKAFSALSSHS
jgi:hypothetical protein